jgi:hypothetical protein
VISHIACNHYHIGLFYQSSRPWLGPDKDENSYRWSRHALLWDASSIIFVSLWFTITDMYSLRCINISRFRQDYAYQGVIKYVLLHFLAVHMSLLSGY